ncbi:hypothetical protein IJG93_02255 [Candidatus Saccharibacteria bacterium]|nr:hypothetical protein [Candidatus Saccharibacteria bacterium]MBQ3436479.1 hypothetical protein [Candidatus Saccharibacteria bacterium]
MDNLKADLKKIYQNERGLMSFMILNLILSIALFIFAIINLNPNASVVKTGYGDIGGYRDGTWVDMLAFPILAIVFGILHNILAIRVFHKRGSGMAKFFLITTVVLILATFLVALRLLGEG